MPATTQEASSWASTVPPGPAQLQPAHLLEQCLEPLAVVARPTPRGSTGPWSGWTSVTASATRRRRGRRPRPRRSGVLSPGVAGADDYVLKLYDHRDWGGRSWSWPPSCSTAPSRPPPDPTPRRPRRRGRLRGHHRRGGRQGGGRGADRALRRRGPVTVRPRGRRARLDRAREPPPPDRTVPPWSRSRPGSAWAVDRRVG
jgi:hypothetical protein